MTIRFASAVLLTRGDMARPQVLLVRRNPKLRFFGGYWAFPGGTVIDADRVDDSESLTMLRCAARELFEETGVLPAGMVDWDEARRSALRDKLLADDHGPWSEATADRDHLWQSFTRVCRLTTPPITPVRYATDFLHLTLPAGQQAEILPGELEAGMFVQPEDALRTWDRGEILIPPPVLAILRLLADGDFGDFLERAGAFEHRLERGALHPVYFTPGIFTAALPTPTLPPATTTNTLLVGEERLFIVDPATPEADEQQRLFDVLDRRIAAGSRPEAILLTHHHADHVGAVNAVSQRYRLPVRAHALAYERIPAGYVRGAPLEEGDRLPLGTAPDGSPDWHLQVLHTPGHAVDHLCFIDSRYRAAIVGDMVSTLSTIVIDPPEGHMRTYLDSLARLRSMDLSMLYPAHGIAHHQPAELLAKYLRHRQEREDQVVAALDDQPRSLEAIVAQAYPEVPEQVWPLAQRSLLAGLIKLQEDGVVSHGDGGWRLKG